MADKLDYFTYEAITAEGRAKKGRIPAATRADALEALQAEGMIPVRVDVFRRSVGNFDIIKPKEERPLKLKMPQASTFARQLYLLVRAGLPMARSLEVIGEDNPDIRYQRMCSQLGERTLAGVPLSVAMADFPGCFDRVFRAYVSAGEMTGNMEEALYRLSRMLEKSNQLRLKVKAVTAYPKMVSIIIGLVVVGIMLWLVPMYSRIFESFGQKLPAPTRALMYVSNLMTPVRMSFGSGFPFISFADTGYKPNLGLPPVVTTDSWNILSSPVNFYSPMIWLVAAAAGWFWYRRRRAGDLEFGARIDRVRYRLPLLGKLWQAAMLHRWSSTLAGGLAAGLQMHLALDVAAEASGSDWVKLITVDLTDAVQAGRPLSRQLAMHPELFDPRLRAMASTGEEAGEPAEMFNNVAVTLEDELDAMVAVLGARIEVALLAIMGVVVGSLLIVLYLPIFGLTQAASEGYSKPPPTIPTDVAP
jgi:type IV pilus assembly protein PilC